MSDTYQNQRTRRGLDLATAADLADLFHELSHNPETRGQVGKLVKKLKPNTPHAEAFKDVEIEDRFESFRAEQEAKELERQQKEMLARMNSARARLLTGDEDGGGRRYSEDDVKAIESLMQKKGITDYEDGATLYAATLPPVDPQPHEITPQHGSTWEFPSWAEFGPDPIKASRNEAHKAITELMRKR
jgi:hypothetical protein